MPIGPPPTAPQDVTVTLNQAVIDLIWAFAAEEFPNATPAEMQAKLVEWAKDGLKTNFLRLKFERLTQENSDEFTQVHDNASVIFS